mmetsp:Transcript_21818/g.56686  ORF Transcript_21818/g.56686 Transcript_21818/m.56686 type:complete len:285 (+) Transcript_21818:229-1083(+)
MYTLPCCLPPPPWPPFSSSSALRWNMCGRTTADLAAFSSAERERLKDTPPPSRCASSFASFSASASMFALSSLAIAFTSASTLLASMLIRSSFSTTFPLLRLCRSMITSLFSNEREEVDIESSTREVEVGMSSVCASMKREEWEKPVFFKLLPTTLPITLTLACTAGAYKCSSSDMLSTTTIEVCCCPSPPPPPPPLSSKLDRATSIASCRPDGDRVGGVKTSNCPSLLFCLTTLSRSSGPVLPSVPSPSSSSPLAGRKEGRREGEEASTKATLFNPLLAHSST